MFRHIFGANQSPLELFLLQRKISGPCWLKISGEGLREMDNNTTGTQRLSYCRVEFHTESADKVSVYRPTNEQVSYKR